MYKVFFNQKPLILTNEIQEFSDSEPFMFIKYSNAGQIIKALKSTKNTKVYLYHKNMDKLWKTFIKQFPVIEAAGGLVERKDNKLLFIFRNKVPVKIVHGTGIFGIFFLRIVLAIFTIV